MPSRSVETRPAVAITAPADFGGRVSARILSAAPITGHAVAPGEMSGPAIELTIEITNGSGAPIDLGLVTVNVTGSDGTPGLQVAGPPASPFSGSLPAAGSARGVYVFTIPTDQRHPLSISISYTAGAPVVLFRGNPT
ncbi:MAG TPA: hypothetical protein VFM01_12600 [Nakamurella sp.]|nr:hypothetical protein [Nakamurella sp.]